MSSQRHNSPQADVILRTSLREECRKRLLEMVIKGQLGENERLNETKLGKTLGVSQTPVREALVALECQGFLTFFPNKGFVVKPFSRKEGHDLYKTIAELEAIALQDAVWPNPQVLDEAEVINQEFLAAQEPEERIELDVSWHDLLVSQADNQYLREIIDHTKKRIFRYEWNFMSGSIEKSYEEHGEIMKELSKGNVESAAEILRSNFLNGLPALDEWLSNRALNRKETEPSPVPRD